MKGKNIEGTRPGSTRVQSSLLLVRHTSRGRELACHRLDQSFQRQIWWSRWAEAIRQARSRDVISPECLSETGLQRVEALLHNTRALICVSRPRTCRTLGDGKSVMHKYALLARD